MRLAYIFKAMCIINYSLFLSQIYATENKILKSESVQETIYSGNLLLDEGNKEYYDECDGEYYSDFILNGININFDKNSNINIKEYNSIFLKNSNIIINGKISCIGNIKLFLNNSNITINNTKDYINLLNINMCNVLLDNGSNITFNNDNENIINILCTNVKLSNNSHINCSKNINFNLCDTGEFLIDNESSLIFLNSEFNVNKEAKIQVNNNSECKFYNSKFILDNCEYKLDESTLLLDNSKCEFNNSIFSLNKCELKINNSNLLYQNINDFDIILNNCELNLDNTSSLDFNNINSYFIMDTCKIFINNKSSLIYQNINNAVFIKNNIFFNNQSNFILSNSNFDFDSNTININDLSNFNNVNSGISLAQEKLYLVNSKCIFGNSTINFGASDIWISGDYQIDENDSDFILQNSTASSSSFDFKFNIYCGHQLLLKHSTLKCVGKLIKIGSDYHDNPNGNLIAKLVDESYFSLDDINIDDNQDINVSPDSVMAVIKNTIFDDLKE